MHFKNRDYHTQSTDWHQRIWLLMALLATGLSAASQTIPAEGKCDLDGGICVISTNMLPDRLDTLHVDSIALYEYARDEAGVITARLAGADTLDQILHIYSSPRPIMSIEVDRKLNAKTKVPARFSVLEHGKPERSGWVGIRWRGASSLSFGDKKNYDLEFWSDSHSQQSRDLRFGELRSDDDWILDGMFNEAARARSTVSQGLWNDLADLAAAPEKPALRTVEILYADVFVNDRYRGVFALSEQVDRKQLNLAKEDTESPGSLLRSVGYTAATRFQDSMNFDTLAVQINGYKWNYPRNTPDWRCLNAFTEAVIQADTPSTVGVVRAYMDWDNFIDYFLFVQVTGGQDNLANNVYWARRDGRSKYELAPWDLDAVFGNNFRGKLAPATKFIRQSSLHSRLLLDSTQTFSLALQARYAELRENLYRPEALIARFASQQWWLAQERIDEREFAKWRRISQKSGDLNYISNWIEERIKFLDGYFQYTPQLSSTEHLTTSQAVLYPNPVSSVLHVRHANSLPQQLTILNAIGQVVRELQVEGNTLSVDISTLPEGLYFLFGERQELGRFLVRR